MLTLGEIADRLGAECRGDRARLIHGVATLSSAGPGQVAFLANPAYRSQLDSTRAGAVILAPSVADACPVDALVMANPYLGFAQVAALLDDSPPPARGQDGSARVHPEAFVDPSAHLGALCVVEAGARIGARAEIGPGCIIGPGAEVGADSRLWANVTLYHGVRVGERCILHSGVVVGSDGFGFAPDKGQWIKIPQTGSVVIEDDVEIGANTVIDRGALDDTRIGRGVKLDNLIQIAHNVQIGDNTAIAGCTAVAGSTRIGRNCTIAGGVGIVGHIEIADRVHVAAMTLVTKSITESGAVASGTGMLPVSEWKKSVARFRQLDDMARRLRQLEAQLRKS